MDNEERSIKLVRQFIDTTELIIDIAATLIEKGIVMQSENIDGQQRVKVRFINNFIVQI